jgi:ribosomal protein L23
MIDYDIIKRPIITEKTNIQKEDSQPGHFRSRSARQPN